MVQREHPLSYPVSAIIHTNSLQHFVHQNPNISSSLIANAVLNFETELVDYEEDQARATSYDRTKIISTLQFWAVPATILFVMYKLYTRYREDTAANVNKKAEKMSKKNKRK